VEHALDPEILDFCMCWNIVPHVESVDEACSGSESDSSPSEDEDVECLGMFEEIVKQLDLNKFSVILKEAQQVALAAEQAKPLQRPYMGHSQMTKYHHKKLCTDLASKGFLPVDQFIKWAEAKRQAARTIHEESEESSDDLCEIISSTDREQGHTSTCDALDSEAPIPRSMASSSAMLHVFRKEDEEGSDDLCEIISGTDHEQGHTSTHNVLDSEALIPRSVASSHAIKV